MIRLTHDELQIRQYSLTMPRLPKGFGAFRLVQLSDLHFYEYSDAAYYDRVLAEVHALKPDMLVVTGDIIHHGPYYIETARRFLTQLDAPLGKFAVMGNHDYKDGNKGKRILAMLRETGYQPLVNESLPIYRNGCDQPLWVAGVDDRYCGKPNVKQAIASIPNEPEPCLLMLLHNPLLFDMVIRDCHLPVDLALAGHTHAGHVYIPILWPIYRYVLHHKYRYGFFERGKHRLYVTSGVGSAAFYFFKKSLQLGLPRFRWNTQPEIAYFDLSPAVN